VPLTKRKTRPPKRFGGRLDFEVQFTAAQRGLPPPARRGLLAWLRDRRKCAGNGHQHRQWWYVSATGERRRL
jgi:hypothetical protein